MGGQGMSKGLKGMSTEQVTEELKLFLERHGKQLQPKPMVTAAAEHNSKV
jgi:hypothetical protein